MFTPPKPEGKFSSSAVPTGFSSGNVASQAQTVIARGVCVEGDFRSQGNVTIEGELVGSIVCGGHLTIGSEASIRASIIADEATISGTVDGNITITHRGDMKATARIKGDITAEALAVESGALLDGRMMIGGAKTAPLLEKKPVPATSA